MLTNTKISRFKSTKNKQEYLSDGNGLVLIATPKGGKWWRFRYTFNGKRNMLSLGTYPEISLADARLQREKLREMVAKGINPSLAHQQEKIQKQNILTFGELIIEWHENHYNDKSKVTADRVMSRLEKGILPWLAKMSITEITPPMLLRVLKKTESRGYFETTHRLKNSCGQAFRYGVACGYCERDITHDLSGALKTHRRKHMATLTDTKEIAQLLRDIDNYKGTYVVRSALQLSLLVFVRPKELSLAKWKNIDFKKMEWKISKDDMKMNNTHIVPLSTQSINVLKDLYPLTGDSKYVFQSNKNKHKPMSSETVNTALKKMGYKNRIVSHGFRAMASTQLNEHGFRYDVIEKQLAHQERNKVRASYNHAQYLKERREMMQWWGDYLEKLKCNS